jgi:hypothetical protein
MVAILEDTNKNNNNVDTKADPMAGISANLKKSRLYLLLSLPSIIAGVVFYFIPEPLLILFLFHTCMLFGIFKYMGKTTINYAEGQLKNLKQQRMLGFGIATAVICSVIGLYAALPTLFPGILDNVQLPFESYSLWYLGLLSLEFAVINPILEEWYWNVFLFSNIKRMYHGKKRGYAKLQVFFAAYHFFVILYLFGLPMAVLGFFLVLLAGVILSFIRNRFGFLVSAMAHFGADCAIVICFLDIMSQKYAALQG